MIKTFVLVGIVGGLVAAYLAVFALGPITQLPPPKSLLTEFRAEGFVPASVNLEENPAVEESGVFQVPAEDKVYLDAAIKAAGDMGGMDMSTSQPDSTQMPAATTDMAAGTTDMAAGATMPNADGQAMDMGEGGLKITDTGSFDREIKLTMSEWKFSDMQIDVKPGEKIKFTVNNGGQIPHEFMFMSMPLMSAVTYRETRADWNLVEHKALYEKALVLPGGEFSFVLEVTQAGTWMFMCMLPYHMEMGMMGQMSTEGAAMQM